MPACTAPALSRIGPAGLDTVGLDREMWFFFLLFLPCSGYDLDIVITLMVSGGLGFCNAESDLHCSALPISGEAIVARVLVPHSVILTTHRRQWPPGTVPSFSGVVDTQ